VARIRTIKPEFFLHEGIADLELSARLAFIGLWCLADREGRLEDRPRSIKVQVLPYDNIDVDKVLEALKDAGFITRYEIAGQRLIQVRGFVKHQKPNPKEVASTLPPPPLGDNASQPGTGSNPIHVGADKCPEQAEVESGFGVELPQPESGSLGKEGKGKGTGTEGGPEEGTPSAGADGVVATPPRRKPGRPPVERHPETAALCEYLAASARGWKSDVRVEATSARSLTGMDALLRRDGRDPDKVRRVIAWLFGSGYRPTSDFDWRPIVLSGVTLRRHWDKLDTLFARHGEQGEESTWTGR